MTLKLVFTASLLEAQHYRLKAQCEEQAGKIIYSQTSVFERNPFQKAVRKAICSKTETIFSIRINVITVILIRSKSRKQLL